MIKKIIFDLDNTLIDWIDEYDYALRDTLIKYNINFDYSLLSNAIDEYDYTSKIYNSYDLMEADIIKNIYNNLDKMPCLKAFSMKCFCKNIGNFYIEFFKKLLTLNLEEIELMIDDNKKSKIYVCPKYELKEICPSIVLFKEI